MSGDVLQVLTWPLNTKKQDKPKLPEPAAKPKKKEEIQEDEKKKIRQGATSTKTILTSPLGLKDEAPVRRRTLLGE